MQHLKAEIISVLDLLPEEGLRVLAEFAEFLRDRFKAAPEQKEQLVQNQDNDPLVGLFAGPADLSERAEELLHQEITRKSGWTWKEKRL